MHSNRSLWRCVLCLLGMACGVCAAQQGEQFHNQLSPTSTSTGSSTGPVTSLLTGFLQGRDSTAVDILYIDAPTTVVQGTTYVPEVTVGEELNAGGDKLNIRNYDQISFTGATNVVAALVDFDGDGTTDYAFAISGVSTDNLCVYHGTGATLAQSGSSSFYDEGDSGYPPTANASEDFCTTLPTQPKPPELSYIAAFPFYRTGTSTGPPQLVVEDSANDLLYIVNVTATALTVEQTLSIPPADGPGQSTTAASTAAATPTSSSTARPTTPQRPTPATVPADSRLASRSPSAVLSTPC